MIELHERRPIEIPDTSFNRYVSFNQALNIRTPQEDTGDWHFAPMFFHQGTQTNRKAHLAGEGCEINTNGALGRLGVREMGDVLAKSGVVENGVAVYTANHFRAMTDMVYSQITRRTRAPMTANVRAINGWLHTEEEIEIVKEQYIRPLRSIFTPEQQAIFDPWIETLVWD